MSVRTSGSIGGRPGAPAPTVGPLPPHELAVPPEESRGGDEEGDPAVTWDDPACRGEEDPVDRLQPGPARRPLQHPELVAKDEDLEVLRVFVALTEISDDDDANESPDDKVEERPHRPMVPVVIRTRIGVSDPHAARRHES
jgi:hypothetical protein